VPEYARIQPFINSYELSAGGSVVVTGSVVVVGVVVVTATVSEVVVTTSAGDSVGGGAV